MQNTTWHYGETAQFNHYGAGNPLSRIKVLKFVHFPQKNADFPAFFVHFDEKISILYKKGGVSALIFYDFGFLVRVKSIL